MSSTEVRPCPACGAPIGIAESHWSLFPEPMGGWVCPPVAPRGEPQILAIDPGFRQSAWLLYDETTKLPVRFAIYDNEILVQRLRELDSSLGFDPHDDPRIAIERVEGFGMAVGVEVFETVLWTGRFMEALHPIPVERVSRKDVKIHLCGTHRAKDQNISQALQDRYGGDRREAMGTKAHPGPLYGISRDIWSALAVAITFAERDQEQPVLFPRLTSGG